MPGCGREVILAGGWIFQNVIAMLISVAGNWLQIHTKKGKGKSKTKLVME